MDQNNLAYHPGPVLPPGGDGSPLLLSASMLSVQVIAQEQRAGPKLTTLREWKIQTVLIFMLSLVIGIC